MNDPNKYCVDVLRDEKSVCVPGNLFQSFIEPLKVGVNLILGLSKSRDSMLIRFRLFFSGHRSFLGQSSCFNLGLSWKPVVAHPL